MDTTRRYRRRQVWGLEEEEGVADQRVLDPSVPQPPVRPADAKKRKSSSGARLGRRAAGNTNVSTVRIEKKAAAATAVAAAADCRPCYVRSQIVHIMTKAVALCGEPGNIDGQVSEYGHDAYAALQDITDDLHAWRLESVAYVRCAIKNVFYAERVELYGTPRLRPVYDLVSTELRDVFCAQYVPGVVGLVHAYLNNKPETYEYYGCLEMINAPMLRRMFQMHRDGVVGALKAELESIKKLDKKTGTRAKINLRHLDEILKSFRRALRNPIMNLSCYPWVTRTAEGYQAELEYLYYHLDTMHSACGYYNE